MAKLFVSSILICCYSNTQKSLQNNGAKYVYLMPLNLLFDSHCLHCGHQQQFKMMKLYIIHYAANQ